MYQIDDGGRLAELSAAIENPSALEAEITLTRYVIERAAQSQNWGLVLSALSVLAKLSTAHAASLIRGSQHLDRTAVIEMGHAAAAVLCELVDELPRLTVQEKTTFRDIFLDRFGAKLATVHNSERKQAKPLLLEHHK